MKKAVSLSTGNWLICDCLKRKAGRRGLTIEQIGYEASMTTDTVKGRIRNLLGKKYVERIEGSRPRRTAACSRNFRRRLSRRKRGS